MTAVSRRKVEAGKGPDPQAAADGANVSHNLNGQKLGRKGRVTRERILAAAAELITESVETPISLSAVARRASLGMTTLYLYFSDLTELLLAVLWPIMHEPGEEGGFYSLLSVYWPDEEIEERSRAFIEAYYAFWARNSRVLHLRNSMADQFDERMHAARIGSAQPVIALIRKQMAPPDAPVTSTSADMASVLFTGIERAVTVATDPVSPTLSERQFGPRKTNVVEPLSRLMAITIRDCRQNGT